MTGSFMLNALIVGAGLCILGRYLPPLLCAVRWCILMITPYGVVALIVFMRDVVRGTKDAMRQQQEQTPANDN